ncbi:hypothetical protein GCM10009554_05370 [Kribbella koreensis]|uniref:Basic secretory peptidase family protein n=1 Tax=Kribbella koreensis TaxID=57909 RepID=A0ABP3ZSS2_9ACTN
MGRRTLGGLREWVAVAGVLAIVAGGAADGAAASSSAEVQVDAAAQVAAVEAVLERRATAVLQHDEGQFLADIDPYNKNLRASQKVLFENLVQFGFSKLAYRQGEAQYDQALLDKYGPTAYLVGGVMEYQIDGIDELPAQTPVGYTFVKRAGRYVLVDDSYLDTDQPDSPNQEAWDTGPVLVQRGPRTLVVVEPGRTEVAKTILADAQVALKAVNRWWLPDWKGGALVIALDDTKVRSTDFKGPVWNDTAAVATPVRRADAGFGGSYVVLNPRDRGQIDAGSLAHEFTHVATASDGPSAPLWLVEGMAEYVRGCRWPASPLSIWRSTASWCVRGTWTRRRRCRPTSSSSARPKRAPTRSAGTPSTIWSASTA